MIPYSQDNSGQVANGERHDFLTIARRISGTIGAEFFFTLTDQLAAALGAKCVYVGEFIQGRSERVRTVAAYCEGHGMETREFPLAGTPDAKVAMGGPCTYMRRVREAFPDDGLLGDLDVEAFVGVPLSDAEGQACGILAALYGQPLDVELPLVQSILKMFVPRASAELSRKRAEEVVRESEQRYRTFVRLNPDACWRIEFDEPIDVTLPEDEQLARILRYGYLAEGNDALVRRLGLETPDQLIGAAVTDVVQDKAFIHSSIQALIRSKYRFSRLEMNVVDRSGKQDYVVLTHWGIVENEKLQRIWGSSRDITELRSIEAQFRHAQRLDSIGRLTAGVAHDFNNLLTVIQGYSNQLLENMNEADAAYIGLKEIRKAAEKAAALTNQMLTFSRKQEIDLRPLNLNTIVAEDEEILRRVIGKSIELTISLEPSLGVVRANSGSIHQLLLNLAVNARDAMPSGGRLNITLSNVDIGEPRRPQLATVPCGPYVRLSISDSGVGMSPDVLAHLFEPFFTTKKETEGTGLGLSTVYGIVRQSGGYITVDSELGRGTTFEIFLPRESPQPPAVSESSLAP
jgi:signal transduction histidine kinase